MSIATKIKEQALKALSFVFSDRIANRVARVFSRRLVEQFRGRATNELVEFLLEGMATAFLLSRSFRDNIQGFSATYVFMTEGGSVGTSARFDGKRMHVEHQPVDDWTVRVRFRDASGLRRFLFSKNQDILQSILDNDVEMDGNVNYIFKFGFLARDLERRLGLQASA
jgi:hypothetical protein